MTCYTSFAVAFTYILSDLTGRKPAVSVLPSILPLRQCFCHFALASFSQAALHPCTLGLQALFPLYHISLCPWASFSQMQPLNLGEKADKGSHTINHMVLNFDDKWACTKPLHQNKLFDWLFCRVCLMLGLLRSESLQHTSLRSKSRHIFAYHN